MYTIGIEVMVANPNYDTSVDVFSFGVMVIHTFTAEWPEPKVGPSRIDPANPDRLIPVTEAERRKEFLRSMTSDHPLMDLVMCCLSNNPQQRPLAAEIVGRMRSVVLEHPPSIENRVEMLQRVTSLLTKKMQLEAEIVRKDLAIEEKVQDITTLTEEKRRQEEDNVRTVEHMQLLHSVEVDQLKLEIEELKISLEDEKVSKVAEISLLANTLTAKIDVLTLQIEREKRKNEQTLVDKDSVIANKDFFIDSVISDKNLIIASRDTFLLKKEATIQSLNNQLTKTREYLTNKSQVSLTNVQQVITFFFYVLLSKLINCF